MSESTLAVSSRPLSLQDAITIIVASRGKNTFHMMGEPGIGKTYIGAGIAKQLGMPFVYIDVPSTDISDIGIPIPDHETKTVRLYPSEHWGLHLGVPVCIWLDEYSKGAPALQAILHPLLTRPRRIGAITLHPDSVVINFLVNKFCNKNKFFFWDTSLLQGKIGSKNFHDSRYFFDNKIFFNPRYSEEIFNNLASYLSFKFNTNIRLVVTDLDNTMWNGLAADDKTEEIDYLPGNSIGEPHYNYQLFKSLKFNDSAMNITNNILFL